MPLRPTPDALRERAFAVLGERVLGSVVLDLFAGTGAVGLEALSRGAERVVFVEQHRAAVRLIEANCGALEVDDGEAKIINLPAARALADLARRSQRFDLIWADPPFDSWQTGLEALQVAAALGVLAADGTACLECPAQARVESGGALEVTRELGGGASRLVLLRHGS